MVIGTLNRTKVCTMLQEANAGSHTEEDSEARRTTSLSYQDELAPSLDQSQVALLSDTKIIAQLSAHCIGICFSETAGQRSSPEPSTRDFWGPRELAQQAR